MDTLSYRTISANQDIIKKEWILIDAEDQVLGRLASEAAKLLRGKHKTYYTPHADCGDYIIVINAEKVKLSGNKWDIKHYFTHSGYPGGDKMSTPRELRAKKPTAMVEEAIRGMLPKTRLGRQIFGNLHVYAGPEHPHQGQQPRELKLNTIK